MLYNILKSLDLQNNPTQIEIQQYLILDVILDNNSITWIHICIYDKSRTNNYDYNKARNIKLQ